MRHASPTAKNVSLVLIYTFSVYPLCVCVCVCVCVYFCFANPSPTFELLVLANAVSHVGWQNKIGHPPQSHYRFKQVPLVSEYK